MTAKEDQGKQSGGGANLHVILEKTQRDLTHAIHYAETSLAEHQPGIGWTKNHMQLIVNLLEGSQNPSTMPTPDMPANLQGVLRQLQVVQNELNERTSPLATHQAVAQTIRYVEAASAKAQEAIRATDPTEVHEKAALAAGLLVAAQGVKGTKSPITGSLSYVVHTLPDGK